MVGFEKINREPKVISHLIGEKDPFPNNEQLPLLILSGAFFFENNLEPSFIEKTFAKNQWKGSWRNGLYPFHHYHSTAHEVLGVYSGSVRVQFGGEEGNKVVAEVGDVLILPAGLSHKNLWSSHDFRVVGAYPEGTSWDMNYGKEEERPHADKNIAQIPLPSSDPVNGPDGSLMNLWKQQK